MPELSFLSPQQAFLLRTLEKIAVGAGTCVLLVTIFASWSPPGLRPVTSFSVGWEHIAAFGLMGGCWGFAFPDRARQLILCLVLTAVILEVGQLFVPERHARLIDVTTKIAGGGAGVLVAHIVRKLMRGALVRGKTYS